MIIASITVECFFGITPILTIFDTVKINRVWIYQEKITKPSLNARRH